MDKVLGLDLGRKTLGIAKSDILGIAHPYKLIRFKKDDYETLLKPIKDIIDEFQIKVVALGLPLHLNGEQSMMSKTCLNFKDMLLKYIPYIDVVMIDERLTSIEAHELLKEMDIDLKKHKQYVDMLAACQILESYLKRKNN